MIKNFKEETLDMLHSYGYEICDIQEYNIKHESESLIITGDYNTFNEDISKVNINYNALRDENENNWAKIKFTGYITFKDGFTVERYRIYGNPRITHYNKSIEKWDSIEYE